MRGAIKLGDTGKYGETNNIATIANKAKHKAMKGPIIVGDTGEFSKYGENENIATIANRAKLKATRGPIIIGDTGEFSKYGVNDNIATIANKAKHRAMTFFKLLIIESNMHFLNNLPFLN